MRDRHLPDALAVTRQFYRTEIDIEGHVRPPRSIEEGVACRVRKPDDAQSSRGVFAPVRDPFVEHDTIPNLAVSNGAERTRYFGAAKCLQLTPVFRFFSAWRVLRPDNRS